MSTLREHIQDQQATGVTLCGVIEAMAILDNEGTGANAISSLIIVAGNLARQITDGLDSANLPKGGAQ